MANRLFELPETKGSFQVQGIVNGVEKDKFYAVSKTKTNKDFRRINFGCEYDDKKSIYLDLNGMPQKEVFFSKRGQDGKTETKRIPWANRNTFNESGFRMIGVNLGIVKTTDEKGNTVNDKKTMHSFDACDYIRDNLKDDVSVFVRGNTEFSSYFDKNGNLTRGIKYIPNQISLCKDVDFDEYDYIDKKPKHDFTQTIVFNGIEQEKEDGKATGRFIVSAQIVTWSDIVNTEFVITDSKLANMFKKHLKPYNAITVHGRIEVSQQVETVMEEDDWGEVNPMNSSKAPFKTEMIITGATGSSIDRETYTEENVNEAISKVRNAKQAEQNFSGDANTEEHEEMDWGEDADDDEAPWD